MMSDQRSAADASKSERPVVRVTREFRSPAEAVFDAWLDPNVLGCWMFGPAVRDEEVVRLQVDPRVGGTFSFLVRRQGAEVDHIGVYRVVDRPCKLVFTWGVVGHSAEESVVTIDISSTDDGCRLTLTHALDPKWADYAVRTEAGWTKMLEKLVEFAGKS